MARRVLLYRTGEAPAPVLADVGSYGSWFTRVIGDRAELLPHWAPTSPAPPIAWDGVVITGSPSSLVEPDPWMGEAGEWIRGLAERGIPVLGVCFGHQLIGRAMGGGVRAHPRGWEMGTREVELTAAGERDGLLDGLPRVFAANLSHRDEVHPLPPGATLLAANAHSPQAFAVGDCLRAVQFHPEMDGPVMRRVIAHRHALLADDARLHGKVHPDRLIAEAGETPLAARVLANFIDRFVARA